VLRIRQVMGEVFALLIFLDIEDLILVCGPSPC